MESPSGMTCKGAADTTASDVAQASIEIATAASLRKHRRRIAASICKEEMLRGYRRQRNFRLAAPIATATRANIVTVAGSGTAPLTATAGWLPSCCCQSK